MNKKIISSSLTKANWIWLILWLPTKHWRERLWNFLRTQCHSIKAMTLCEPLSTFSFYFLFSIHISQNTKCPERYLKHLTSSVNGSEDAIWRLELGNNCLCVASFALFSLHVIVTQNTIFLLRAIVIVLINNQTADRSKLVFNKHWSVIALHFRMSKFRHFSFGPKKIQL